MAAIGERDLRRRIERMIENVQEEVKGALTESALLVERDAKIKVPVDTGRLRSSISHSEEFEADNPAVVVGTNTEYASYIELGTSRQAAKPFLYPALSENRQRIQRKIAESVRRGAGL